MTNIKILYIFVSEIIKETVMVKIKEYKIKLFKDKYIVFAIPSLYRKDLNLTDGDILEVYRGDFDGYGDCLLIVPKKKNIYKVNPE